MARRQLHCGHFSNIPSTHHDTAAIGRVFDLVNDLCNLVDGSTIAIGPSAPLAAIDGTQVSILVGPLVPDAYAMLLQPSHIGVTTQEPQQFIDDGLEVHLLGRQQGESVGQIAAQLIAEHTACACSRAVFLVHTVFHHMAHQIKILFHRLSFVLLLSPIENVTQYPPENHQCK